MKKVLILGGGISGSSANHLLKSKSNYTILVDRQKPSNLESDDFILDNIDIHLNSDVSLIVKSPGISPNHPLLLQAKQKGIQIISEIDLGFEYFTGHVIAITGTDGKSTTTALTGHIIKNSFFKTKAGGNLGTPFTEFCTEDLDFAVLELSSYQLEDSNHLNVQSSAILNLATDHLERHQTMDNYFKAKQRIIPNSLDKTFVTNHKLMDKYPTDLKTKLITFGFNSTDHAYIDLNSNQIHTNQFSYDTKEYPLTGLHNLENLAASILLAESVHCPTQKIQESFKTFTGLPFRFYLYKTIQGTKFINDSKSTNIHSMLSGLKGISPQEPNALIIGGQTKKEDIQPMISDLVQRNIRVYLYGQAAFEWKDELKFHLKDRLYICKDLEDVFVHLHKDYSQFRFTQIIFSPACASFDQYKNFEERGHHFNQLVDKFSMRFPIS